MDPFATHEVSNQPLPFEDVDLFATDLPLQEGVAREGGGWASQRLSTFGTRVGSAAVMELGARPTATSRSFGPTTATATASTRSTSIRPGTR